MNFKNLSLALMLLLSSTSAVSIQNKARAEVEVEAETSVSKKNKDPRLLPQPEKGPSPAEVMDLGPWFVQTPAFRDTSKPPNWKKNYRSLNVRIGDMKYSRPHFQSEYFHVVDDDKVRFAVPLFGSRTSYGVKTPRCELGEQQRWSMVEGEHRMEVSLNVAKAVPGVNFEIGQILRTNRGVKYSHGRACPLHLQVDYHPDYEQMALKIRLAECEYKKIKIPTKFPVGEEFGYSVDVKDGIMTFETTKGDHVVVGDFNFLEEEKGGAAIGGQFKTGIYMGKSCARLDDPSKCEFGKPDELTIVDFSHIKVEHNGEGLM